MVMFSGFSSRTVSTVRRKPRDQIHIHRETSDLADLQQRPDDVLRTVLSPDRLQHRIFHRLRVDAHPVHTVLSKRAKLLFGNGVRPSGFYGAFSQRREIEFRFDLRQEAVQLAFVQSRRGSAAHVNRYHPKPVFTHLFRHGMQFLLQSFQKRRNLPHAFFHGLADKTAVGTARRAERDPHIEADVSLLQQTVCPDGGSRGIKAEHRPVMRDVIFRLKPPQSFLLRHTMLQHRAHQLSRPHPRQGAPDWLLSPGTQYRTVDRELHDLLAETVCLDPLGQAPALYGRTSMKALFAITVQTARRGHPRAFTETDFHPLPLRFSVRILRSLPREQGHQHLFRGILILMSVKI